MSISSSSVLINNNNESWLAVEGNVIRVFTTKSSAVQYRSDNIEKSINVLHRYSDGSMQPLLCWPGHTEENSAPLMDIIEEEFYDDYRDGFEDALDFYELVAANDEYAAEKDQKEDEPE